MRVAGRIGVRVHTEAGDVCAGGPVVRHTAGRVARLDGRQVGLGQFGQHDRLRLNAFWRSSRNAIDQVNEQVFALDNYNVIDLTATYRLNDVLEFQARIENAGNAHYEEVIGYRNAGRTAYIGFRATL